MLFSFLFFSFLLLLTSCGESGFDGTYEAAGGAQEFIFKSDGYVTQSLMGKKVADYKYEKNGNEIKFHVNENTPVILTLQEDGSIVMSPGIVLTPIN